MKIELTEDVAHKIKNILRDQQDAESGLEIALKIVGRIKRSLWDNIREDIPNAIDLHSPDTGAWYVTVPDKEPCDGND